MKILDLFAKKEQPPEGLIKSYNELPDKVKANVVKYLRHCMFEVYHVNARVADYTALLIQVNPLIVFFIDSEGKKKFRFDDSDEELTRHLGTALAEAAKVDPRIMDQVILKMVSRNDGADRLKVK